MSPTHAARRLAAALASGDGDRVRAARAAYIAAEAAAADPGPLYQAERGALITAAAATAHRRADALGPAAVPDRPELGGDLFG